MSLRHDSPQPRVSVVIPVYNKLELTQMCLESLARDETAASREIIVVDNGSTDGTTAWLQQQEAAGKLQAVINSRNGGFAAGCNRGAEEAIGQCILFLNNDMEVTPGWLDPLVTTLDHDPTVGIVGAKLLFPDQRIQHAGVALVECVEERGPVLKGDHIHYRKPADHPAAGIAQQLQIVTGACLAIRNELFRELGGFDEGYWNGNEDVDLCLKAGQRGWKVVYRPESVVIHYESQSGPERWSRVQPNIERFNAIWRDTGRPDFTVARDGAVAATPHHAIRPYVGPRYEPSDRASASTATPVVSVVVLTYNALEYTRLCAASLVRYTDARHELIFVDNGSDGETQEFLRELAAENDRVQAIFNGTNLGFAAGNNVGIAAACGDYVCLLNSDTVVTDQWLERLLAPAEADPRVGLVGPVTNSITGSQKLPDVPYNQASLAGLEKFAAALGSQFSGRNQQALWVVGFCVLIRRELIERIGGLDESFGRGNYEDTDYCLRAFLAGYRAVVAFDSFVHHFGSRSFVAAGVDYARQLDEKFEIFRRKWNLPPGARQDGNLKLETLVAEGFVAPLHISPLPDSNSWLALPLARWEAEVWVGIGEKYFQAGRLTAAEQVFRAVLLHLPDCSRAANDLACTLWQAQLADDVAAAESSCLAEAISVLNDILSRDPDNEDARWNLQEIAGAAASLADVEVG